MLGDADYFKLGIRALKQGPPGRFMLHDNARRNVCDLKSYPEDAPVATKEHEIWVEEQVPWKDLW